MTGAPVCVLFDGLDTGSRAESGETRTDKDAHGLVTLHQRMALLEEGDQRRRVAGSNAPRIAHQNPPTGISTVPTAKCQS